MDIMGASFFFFLLLELFLFYGIKPLQKYSLLLASLYFYIQISPIGTIKVCMLIAGIGLVVYIGALAID